MIRKKLATLINVKTLVTFAVVGVYLAMLLLGVSVPEFFAGLVMTVVAFYFGTQKQKQEDESEVK